MAKAVSHDQNFKNLILDYPRQALEFFAPEEAPAPEDDVRILPVRQQQLQERLGQRYHELDTPLRVDWADGRRDAVVFALEEETDGWRFSPHPAGTLLPGCRRADRDGPRGAGVDLPARHPCAGNPGARHGARSLSHVRPRLVPGSPR